MKKYFCIKQHDMTDCGAACLATICKQNKFNVSIAKIREVAGTDKQGTNVYGIIKAAQQLGFEAKGVKGSENTLFSSLPFPCIAHVVVDGNQFHYVVIQKIKGNKMIIADPAIGLIKIKIKHFLGDETSEKKAPMYKWTGILILMSPKKHVIREKEAVEGTYSRFFFMLISQRKLFLHITIASLVYTILGMVGAFYFKELIDTILPGELVKSLTTISIGVIILNIFKVVLGAFRTQLLIYLGQNIDVSMLLGYCHHVMKLPMSFFDKRNVGDILSRFNDASKVRDAISGVTLTIIIDSMMTIVGAIILYLQNAKLLMVAVIMVLFYVVIAICFDKFFEKLNRINMENNAKLTAYLIESLNGIETIKSYNAEQQVNEKIQIKLLKLLKSIFNLSWICNIQSSLKTFVELVGGIVILWVGAICVINGEMTIGTLITFNSLLVYFLEPVRNLINLQPQIHTAKIAAQRLGEILDLELEKTEKECRKIVPKSLSGSIEVKNLIFRYGTRKIILDNVNLVIKKGQKVAFVGESGSGKTTLAKLLLRMYSPESGEILIDGNNIEDIQLDRLREKIAYISQDTFLFGGTIYENLVLGLNDVAMDDVISASKAACAHEFINSLPLRYETRLEENGGNLSGGQRQRLAITRALLKKPDILIFDEATSNLDSITERAIDKTINDLSKEITIIFIAHRLSMVQKCDVIFVMDNGEIIEKGSHQELMALDGKYTQLVNGQVNQ